MKKFLLIGVIAGWLAFQHSNYLLRLWHTIPGLSEEPTYIFKTNSKDLDLKHFPLPKEQTFIFKRCNTEIPKPAEAEKPERKKGGIRVTQAYDLWKDPLLRVIL